MKPVTDEQLAAHTRATHRGMAEGLAASLLAGSAGGYYLNRKYAGWRALPPSLKALAMVILVIPVVSIQGEQRGVQYDETTWEGASVTMRNEKLSAEDARWEALSTPEKISDWSGRHQYTLIMGSWALSLAVAGAVISRDKYQTFPQKIVQARMWAQGLTIGILIAAGALTSTTRAQAAAHPTVDHSWRELIDQQEKEKAVKTLTRPVGTIRV